MVNVGTRQNPTYLPAQVCEILPGQPANSKLDAGQTQQMIRFAVQRPQENMAAIAGDGRATVGLTSPGLVS